MLRGDGVLYMLVGSCTKLSLGKLQSMEETPSELAALIFKDLMLCLLSLVAGCWTHSEIVLVPLFSEGVDVLHRFTS